MKRALSALAAAGLALTLLAGCGDNGDAPAADATTPVADVNGDEPTEPTEAPEEPGQTLDTEILGDWTYRGMAWFTFNADGTGTAGGDPMTWTISGDTLTMNSDSGNFTWMQGARLDTRVEIDGDEMTHVWQGRGQGTHVYVRSN
jgi:predicted small lipoprotein YifL